MARISLLTLLISVLIAGCASTAIKPEERDTTGKFDGAWYVSWHIRKHTTVIEGSGTFWQVRCAEYAHGIPVQISDGTIPSPIPGGEPAYVREDGAVYLNWQIPDTKTSKDIEDRRLILSGKLEERRGEGTIVLTIDSPTEGCRGTFTMERTD